jgi:hypothetical protein
VADEERGKRRRGRRGGRGGGHRRPIEERDEARSAEPEEPIITEEESPGQPTVRRFRFGGGGKKDSGGAKERGRREERGSPTAAGSVSPMDFWRSGSSRLPAGADHGRWGRGG